MHTITICPKVFFPHEEEKQSFKLALGQPCVWSVSDFVFLASVCEGRWPVLSLIVSSSHWQCAVSILIIAAFARGCRWSRNLKPNFCFRWDLNPKPLDWQSSLPSWLKINDFAVAFGEESSERNTCSKTLDKDIYNRTKALDIDIYNRTVGI